MLVAGMYDKKKKNSKKTPHYLYYYCRGFKLSKLEKGESQIVCFFLSVLTLVHIFPQGMLQLWILERTIPTFYSSDQFLRFHNST